MTIQKGEAIMNTLCLYYENAAARRIAVMIGSILSMSRYAECREDVSLRQYKRILLVLTEKQAVQPLAEVVQHAEPDTIWGLIVIGDNELSVQRLRRQAEMLLKRPIALSAFIPASDVTEGVIRAAETIQPPPAAVPDSDSTAWQALENVPDESYYGRFSYRMGTEYSDDADRVRILA